jgi:hypothetical protein
MLCKSPLLIDTGTVLSFLRLEKQRRALEDVSPLPDFRELALERLLPATTLHKLSPSRLSPLTSPLGDVVLRILAALEAPSKTDGVGTILSDDIMALNQAVELSSKHGRFTEHKGHRMGDDEMLYGRTGLLWAILNIRSHALDRSTYSAMQPMFDGVPQLVRVVLEAGREGAKDFVRQHGSENAFPLMWVWMEGYYGLGA